jgi:hypothetical protein
MAGSGSRWCRRVTPPGPRREKSGLHARSDLAGPKLAEPDPNRTVWATAFDGRGRVVSDLQKTLRSFYGATGVVESNDRLYLVSIERRAILSLDLCAVCDCAEAHAQDAAWRSAEQTPGSTFGCPWRINDAVPAERGRPHESGRAVPFSHMRSRCGRAGCTYHLRYIPKSFARHLSECRCGVSEFRILSFVGARGDLTCWRIWRRSEHPSITS